jgi:hypothetical protein
MICDWDYWQCRHIIAVPFCEEFIGPVAAGSSGLVVSALEHVGREIESDRVNGGRL